MTAAAPALALVPEAPASTTRFRATTPRPDCTRLVLYLASRAARPGVGVEDLVQVGHLALLDAERLYRDDGGASFTSFATSRIKFAMGRVVRRERRGGLTPATRAQPDEPSLASMDATTDEGDGASLHDVVGADGGQEASCEATRLRDAIASLPERERVVVVALAAGTSRDEIGRRLGVSRWVVGSIERSAIERLRKRAG